MLKALFYFCIAGLTAQLVTGGELSLVGAHPTSPLTAFPAIHTLKAHEGRIYMGYGNWNVYPAAVVVSYDPISNSFCVEHSAPTDSLDHFRSIGGKLYAPSMDPIHFEGFQDFTVRDAGVWRSYTPSGFFHVFDMDTVTGSDLWFVGGKSQNETASDGAAVMRSTDGGRTWVDLTGTATQIRYYYGFALRGRFYVSDRIYDGNTATAIGGAPGLLYRATAAGSGPDEFIVGLSGRIPGFVASLPRALMSFDGTTWRQLSAAVHNFAVANGTLYTLVSNELWRASSLSATQAVWEKLPLSGVTNASAIEVLGQVIYVADEQGRLWAGRLDGMPLEQTPASVVNELPDAFGRALALSGSTLVAGAPDHSDATFLSGEVTVWEQTNSTWILRQVIAPPEPSFSGWFGKDVAVAGDIMAVSEAGKDLSRLDRGSAAQVHLYQRTSEGWQLLQSLAHPYTHAVALDSQRLAVATTSELHIYTLTGTGTVQAVRETNLAHNVASTTLYEPAGRVAIDGERIAYGLVGDFSRQGGPGQVNVYERKANGSWILVTNLVQNSPPLPTGLARHPDAFGFALSSKNGWLAVGAPRDDTSAPQAGAVHLYERINSVEGEPSYVLRQTITSPFAQTEARFGQAVSLSDSHLVIGAPGTDILDRQEGRVFIYQYQHPTWVAVGEALAPVGSQGELGLEVAVTTNLVFAGCRAAPQFTNLFERVAIRPIPDGTSAADLRVTHSVSPSVVTNGSQMTYHVAVTNGGPLTATAIQLVFSNPNNVEIQSIISDGFACTNTGTEVRCTLEELATGSGQSLLIHAQAKLPNPCGTIQSQVTVLADEFDPNVSNNRALATAISQPPEIRLISPADGTMVPFGGSVQITAEASSDNAAIEHVSIYAHTNLLRSFTGPPYDYVWTNIPSGVYALSARVFNACGISSTSAVRIISVRSNMLPQVTLLSPASGTRFSNTKNIPIYVSASDPDGTIDFVGVYRDHAPWRALRNPPYHTVWSNAPNGSHVLQVAAFDKQGGATTSYLARIFVGAEQSSGTNWAAYNDHSPGAATRSTVSRWDILGAAPGPEGPLRHGATGANLPAWLTITRSATAFVSAGGVAPEAGSPAAQIFGGYTDFVTGSSANVGMAGPAWIRYTFRGLDPNLRYGFHGTVVRGNADYTNRWTLVELSGVRSFNTAHTSGCLTHGTGSIRSNQVAFNTGFNLAGDVVGWSDIQPDRDGTFSVICMQYLGIVPTGSSEGPLGYALTAVRLEEINVPVDPQPAITGQPLSVTTSPGSQARFSVMATGQGPLTYQWLLNNGALPGRTADVLTFDPASTNDAGSYSVIVTGESGSTVSQAAALTFVTVGIQPEAAAQLTVYGPVGQRYSVEHLDSIQQVLTWNEVTNFALPSNPFTLTDEESRNFSHRFYRVIPTP